MLFAKICKEDFQISQTSMKTENTKTTGAFIPSEGLSLSFNYVWTELALSGVTKLKNKLHVYLSIQTKLLQIWSAFHCKTCMEIHLMEH